jgi:hypothetical protein
VELATVIKHTYFINGAHGICGVSMHRHRGRFTVVLTEISANRGVRVSNAIEELATDIAGGLVESGAVAHPTRIQWIEHTEPAADPMPFGAWARVTMQWNGHRYCDPCWEPLSGERRRWASRNAAAGCQLSIPRQHFKGAPAPSRRDTRARPRPWFSYPLHLIKHGATSWLKSLWKEASALRSRTHKYSHQLTHWRDSK